MPDHHGKGFPPIVVAVIAADPAIPTLLAKRIALRRGTVQSAHFVSDILGTGQTAQVAVLAVPAAEEAAALAELSTTAGPLPFLVLSEVNDVRRAVHALKRGAADYFARDPDGRWVDEMVAAVYSTVWSHDDAEPELELSKRERQCLQWSARGFNTNAIAFRLGISERTVRFHVGNAMTKLQATSRTHAIARAIQLGLLPPVP